MRIIGNDPNKPRQTAAVASGTLPNGKPVVVNSDGTVSVVKQVTSSQALGTPVEHQSTGVEGSVVVYSGIENKFVLFFRDSSNSNYGTARVVTVDPSDNSITYGAKVVYKSAYTEPQGGCLDVASGNVVHSYKNISAEGEVVVGTVSGTSITFGTAATMNQNDPDVMCARYDPTNQKVVFCYVTNDNYGRARVGTVSGTSISFGSEYVFASANTQLYQQNSTMTYDASADKMVIVFKDVGNSNYGKAIVASVSGTALSFGAETTYQNAKSEYNAIAYDPSSGKNLITYYYSDTNGRAVVGTVSGTSISFGSITSFDSGRTFKISMVGSTLAGKVTIAYEDDSDSEKGKIIVGTISGTDPTFGSEVVFDSNAINETAMDIDPNSGKIVIGYAEKTSGDGRAVVFQPEQLEPNLTAENYIGMSQGPVQVFAEGAGSLVEYHSTDTRGNNIAYDAASGKFVAIFNPGPPTSSPPAGYAIVGTVDPSDNSITYGTPVQFESGEVYGDQMGITYDSNAEKVVIAYKNSATNVAYGIVGTVSGTSISFGSPTTFNNNCQFITAAFDSTNNKVVIVYKDNSNLDYGTAIVGTVSGTSISFGTKAVFNSGNTSYANLCFDSTNSKIIIGYRDQAFQQQATCVVGTVSGTSISFGSEVTVSPNSATHTVPIYDPVAEKVVFVYTDSSDSDKGKVKIGTVSGTSISFGDAVTFESNVAEQSAGVFDANAGKVTIAYKSGPSGYPQIISGTVSGDTMTFGDAVQLGSFAAAGYRFGCAYDSANFRIVSVFIDSDATPDNGESAVFNNFYEIRPSIADGGNALLDTQGGVSENQSSLTAGQSYYVQTDGTISTTAGSPSVFAGTAVSSTKLIVKG